MEGSEVLHDEFLNEGMYSVLDAVRIMLSM
jgi:hypothetical protein